MEAPLILIVEDEKDIARFIELELQAEGYRTEVAHDGITGLSRFREVNPNLVILDLMLLAKNPGKVFSRYEIEEKVWPGYQGGSNVVDVYIGYLRKKLEAGGERRLIHTVRGVGYVLRED